MKKIVLWCLLILCLAYNYNAQTFAVGFGRVTDQKGIGISRVVVRASSPTLCDGEARSVTNIFGYYSIVLQTECEYNVIFLEFVKGGYNYSIPSGYKIPYKEPTTENFNRLDFEIFK